MKKQFLIAALLGASLLLTSCDMTTKLEKIDVEQAKNVALVALGLEGEEINQIEAELKEKNGQKYYDVDVVVDGVKYEFDVDAISGVIIARDTDDDSKPLVTTGYVPQKTEPAVSSVYAEVISEEKAYEIALAAAGVTVEEAHIFMHELDLDDGEFEYEIAFLSTVDNTVYRYEIDAVSGAVKSYSSQPKAADSGNGSNELVILPNGSLITGVLDEAQAKEIALAQVPGATESDIREFEIDMDDDGKLEYEGEIVYGGMEYEFEIDGYSGAIRSWEVEPVGE